MLFHVTATHLPEHCPLYNPEMQAGMADAGKNIEATATELGIKIHFSVTGAPDHVIFHLVETESLESLRRWLALVPIKQDFRITPVESTIAASTSIGQDAARR